MLAVPHGGTKLKPSRAEVTALPAVVLEPYLHAVVGPRPHGLLAPLLVQARPAHVGHPVGAVLELVLVVEGEGRVVGAPRRAVVLRGGTGEEGRLRLRLGLGGLLGRGTGRRRRRRGVDRRGRRGGRGRGKRPARDLLRPARAVLRLRRRHGNRRAVITAPPAVVLDAQVGALHELAAALEDHRTDARQPVAAVVGHSPAEVYDVVQVVGARGRLGLLGLGLGRRLRRRLLRLRLLGWLV